MNNDFPKYFELDNDLYVKLYIDSITGGVLAETKEGKPFDVAVALSKYEREITEKEFNESVRQQ